jgi:peroxiredoxin
MKKINAALLALGYALAFAYYGPLELRLPSPEAPPAAREPSVPAPLFTLPAAAGGKISLASYAGKPVLLMFFTESCPYCRAAGPAIERLAAQYAPEGLSALGVCLDEDRQAALNFAKDLGVTFPLAYAGRNAFREYHGLGVPYIYLVDAKGYIYDVWEGYDESYLPAMHEAVEKLLRGK